MIYRTLFPRDLFSDLERLQRELHPSYGGLPSIRGVARSYPSLNVGTSTRSVEVFAFAPGLDPAKLELHIDKGVLTISGERSPDTLPEQATVHIDERFTGPFRRVVNLPDDVDADQVQARYRDGVVHISLPRQAAAQPRRINVY